MELLRFQNVRKDIGHRTILSDVTFRINAGEKVGMIGANGAGKTTILRLITGDDPPTAGAITRASGTRIGYVPQHLEFDGAPRVLDVVLAAQSAAAEKLRRAEDALAAASPDRLDASIDAHHDALTEFERAGGDELRAQAVAMLDALGLVGRAEQRVTELSGGEKSIVALARALLAQPDILVLDEPGNHLDFAGIAWLEAFLRSFRGAVLVVSHNRYLLDRVATAILKVSDGRVQSYAGNYSAFRAIELREKLSQRADYIADQKRLVQLEELVKRFEEIARRTADPAWGKRLRARKSQLARAKEDASEMPAAESSKLRMTLSAAASRADIALQLRGYSKSFGERVLFDTADLEVSSGDRLALIGPNGSGKTTLLRDIVAVGAWDHDVIRIGPSMRVGYCAQEQEILDDSRSVFAEMVAAAPMTREKAFGLLSQFLFRPDDLTKLVGTLSGGERNRLQLARLMAQQPDFLILDEPTNHLDIPACEAIEEALADFRGTILAVSHDRYFLDKIADRVVELRDGRFDTYAGNFSEYWQERQAAMPPPTAWVTTRRSARHDANRRSVGASEKPRPPSELQRRIEQAEREKLELERRVSDAFTRGDHREGTRAATLLDRHRSRLDALYARWLEEERSTDG